MHRRVAVSALGVLVVVLGGSGRVSAQAKVLLDIHGSAAHQFLGYSVAGAGDVDGDGVPDILVGDLTKSFPVPSTGVRVISGADGSVIHEFLGNLFVGSSVAGLGDLDGDQRAEVLIGYPDESRYEVRSGATGAVKFSGHGTSPWGGTAPNFGWSVGSAGDVNADGVPDYIVGSGADGFLDAAGDQFRICSGVDGSTLHEINAFDPISDPKSIGWSVASLGDVNGDGHDDVAVGMPLWSFGSNDGQVVVYSGADLAVLHTFSGFSSVGLGWRVANAGDVDGDGVDDVACGRHAAKNGAVVFSGATGTRLLHTGGLPGSVNGDDLDLAGLGDLDGDGLSDLALTRNGAVYLVSGADGRQLLALENLPSGGFGGTLIDSLAVANAGDVDGDGRNDIVIGDRWDDTAGADAGRAFVISGRPEPWTDLGHALEGAAGPPVLGGTGSLEPGSPGHVAVANVPVNALVVLFIGFSPGNAPFKGGLLVPSPDIVLAFVAGPLGAVVWPWVGWPTGIPAFTAFWLQAWAADPTAPAGASASNALLVTTP